MTEVKSNEMGQCKLLTTLPSIQSQRVCTFHPPVFEGKKLKKGRHYRKNLKCSSRLSLSTMKYTTCTKECQNGLVHSYLFSTAKSNPEWKHIETTSSKHLVCKHNPVELLAAISSLAETYSITVTASFSLMPISLSFVPPRSEESPVSVFGSLPGTKQTNTKIWLESSQRKYGQSMLLTTVPAQSILSQRIRSKK